jgi:hypothetical protein
VLAHKPRQSRLQVKPTLGIGGLMKSSLRDSVDTVVPYWPWITFLGVAGVFGSNRIWQEFSIPILIAVFAITIYIYGRITSDIARGRTQSAWHILGENCVNYMIVVLLLGAPQAAFRVVAAGRFDSWYLYVLFSTILGSALGALTIYALPIAFLRKMNLGAILAGVVYLSRNLAVSSWIIGVVIIANLLGTVGALVFRLETTPWSFVLALSTGVLGFSISYVAFAGALKVLLEGGERDTGLHA